MTPRRYLLGVALVATAAGGLVLAVPGTVIEIEADRVPVAVG